MSDITPESIRDNAIDCIAQAFYTAEAADILATTGRPSPPWGGLDKSDAHRCIQDARLAVDALAKAGMLPISEHRDLIGGFQYGRHKLDGPHPPTVLMRSYATGSKPVEDTPENRAALEEINQDWLRYISNAPDEQAGGTDA